jgi:hypothetical protein
VISLTLRPRTLTPDEIFRIAFYRGQNKSVREIATLLNHHKTAVGDFVHSYHHLFEAEDEANFMLSDFTDFAVFTDSYPPERWLLRHYLIYIVAENPRFNVRHIAERLEQGGFPFKVQKTKVSDELPDMSIQSVYPIPVPRMTEQQCRDRELFAAKTLTDFRILLPWMFTDKVMFSRNNDNYLVRRIPTLQPPDEFYTRTEQYPIRIMGWAAIARDFKSPIMRMNERLNAEGYQQMVWESGVIQHMNGRDGRHAWIFEQDGASPHQAKTSGRHDCHCSLIISRISQSESDYGRPALCPTRFSNLRCLFLSLGESIFFRCLSR